MRFTGVCLAVAAWLVAASWASSAVTGDAPPRVDGLVDRTEVVRRAVVGGRARGVIVMIGDGMGDSEITMTRNYHVGAAGRLHLDELPLTGAYTTSALLEENPALPDYVVDSAASATAWATGHKTSNFRLSTNAATDQPLKTIVELAQEHGLPIGSVTTAELTDATPAALVSHVNNRSCEGPENMAPCPRYKKSAGGLGSIAEQSVDHHVDLLLGGGRARFEQSIDAGPYAGQTVTQSAIAQGYRVVADAEQLEGAHAGPLLGLFASADMSLEWSGAPAAIYPGSGPQRCTEQQRPSNEPSLAAMTSKAIELLTERAAAVRRGFLLQVEGASIDKRAHAADPCGAIGEAVAFDAAVEVVLGYARLHPDTLVVVTGDHAHTVQIVPPQTEADHSPGMLSTLLTADGVPMTIHYATNVPGHKQEHTGTQIRIAAQGPQAANVVGVTDQTELFYTMARALGLFEVDEPGGFLHAIHRMFGIE